MSIPFLHSIFRSSKKENKQRLTPVQDANKQTAAFVGTLFSLDSETSKEVVRRLVAKNNPIDPVTIYYNRDKNLDRHKTVSSLSNYISEIEAGDDIIIPSYTTNISKEKQLSLHSGYIKINLAKRKKAKGESFASLADGDMVNYHKMDTIQKAMKTLNNSLSGAYASKSTILGNNASSQHYTLTSTTRAITSLANAIGESFISGSRLYFEFDNIIDHINTILVEADLEQLRLVIQKYKLYMPNSKDCLDVIKRSSDSYWVSEEAEGFLLSYLDKLLPLQRAAFVYVNDFYHLRKYNEEFVRELFTRFSFSGKTADTTDYVEYMKTVPEEIEGVAIHINMDLVTGVKLKYSELTDTDIPMMIANSSRNFMTNLEDYKDFIRAFFVTHILPIDVAHIKDMLRRAAVLSDTDSTCSTMDEWSEWYYRGNVPKGNATFAVSSIITFFTSQLVDNNIKVLATNMNIAPDDRELLEMKSEYTWSSFSQTKGMSKTYYARAMVREGFVFKKPELELKGVHLINSGSIFKQEIDSMIIEIGDKVSRNEMIDLREYLTKVADMERGIINKIKNGDLGLFKLKTLKGSSSYALGPDKSPYTHHTIWKDVFAPKYGELDEPEYLTYSLPLKINKPSLFKDYLLNMEDKGLANRLQGVADKLGKKYIGTFMLNSDYAESKGLPIELFEALDLKRVLDSNLKAAYLMLCSLGYYKSDVELLSDTY